MKTIVLGDTHGRTCWKEILDQNFDRVIFIGDFFDTHEDITGLEQLNNFEEICKYKRESTKEIILLVGNHDHHYWPGITGERYSGFQRGMYTSFQHALNENKDLFQMCFVDENDYVYSHAGFTETFVEQRIGTFSMDNVNMIWKHKPQTFNFYNFDRSGCGDDIHQSCIWVRPQSLYRDGINKLQIVGHTMVRTINALKSERQGFYLIDALGTSGEYLIITDGKIEICKPSFTKQTKIVNNL